MQEHYPAIPFKRFADDAICHCTTLAQAQHLRQVLEARIVQHRLELHPQKTRITHCKDSGCRGSYLNQS